MAPLFPPKAPMTLREALDLAGYVSTALVFASAVAAAVVWAVGIGPALWRLGNGLACRRIAVFAKDGALTSLDALLADSRLFWKANIINVGAEGDIGKAERATLFLVHWPDWTDTWKKILDQKRDGTALIVYAPQDKGRIPADVLEEMNNARNVVICNFRGRLLNDIVTSMITTSYEKA